MPRRREGTKLLRPVVSVILPFFRDAATLAPAIDSILSQKSADFEVILYDDGAEGAARDVALNAAAQAPRVRVLGGAHVGIAVALQRGCAAARGRYIARMDADDVAHPERLAAQHALMESDARVALFGTQVVLSCEDIGSGRERYRELINALTTHEDLLRELYVECPLPHPTFFMRRDAYEAVGGYRAGEYPEDYDLVLRFVTAGYRLGKVARPLLHWRHRPDRLSMTDPRYGLDRFRALKREHLLATRLAGGRPFYQWGAGEVGKAWLR
ncbi:MAG: glycosyltransferase family 2 protein, partial [Candidatus Hydrogenedentales bacterium]